MDMQSKLGNYFKAINLSNPILLVFLLGAVIRLYNSWFTFYLNSDGVLYINQAKIIYYGQWDLLPSSGLVYLSNYPFLIAGAYTIFQNWLLAAKAISFAFGSLSLVPLYFLFRQFFDNKVSTLGTLLYALVPVFVKSSADVIRDPVYWFFVVSGMYLFTLHRQPGYRLYVVLSSLFFLMAAWARVEAFLLIVVTSVYLMIPEHQWLKKLLLFLAPLLTAAALLMTLPLITGNSIDFINRFPEIMEKLTVPLTQYQKLGTEVQSLRLSIPADYDIMYQFIDKAGNFAWLVALATLVNHFLEGFFHPFCLVLIVGMVGSFARLKKGPFLIYFISISVLGGALVYCHLLIGWIIDSRFLAIAMLPLFFYIGRGFEKIVQFMKNRFTFTEYTAITVICFVLLLAGIPKNLYYREADKLVFKEIGEYVSELEGANSEYISVSSSSTIRQFAFYANLKNNKTILPPLGTLVAYTQQGYKKFLLYLKIYKVDYFLWEENFWARQPFNAINMLDNRKFIELRRWYHPDTGKLILFKVSQ